VETGVNSNSLAEHSNIGRQTVPTRTLKDMTPVNGSVAKMTNQKRRNTRALQTLREIQHAGLLREAFGVRARIPPLSPQMGGTVSQETRIIFKSAGHLLGFPLLAANG